MRKIEGLKFLQRYFPESTIDCTFVRDEQDVKKLMHDKSFDNEGKLLRVRGASKIGSELNLPMQTFTSLKDIRKFVKTQHKQNENLEFIIHRVAPDYFQVPYVGTLAVYNNKISPSIRIELQKVTEELVASIDKGKRPRDWDSCLILDYEFLNKSPKILKNNNVNINSLKEPIVKLYKIGEKIFSIYEKAGQEIETYTRFNIYDSGDILLDDHRSSDSFINKYKVKNLATPAVKSVTASDANLRSNVDLNGKENDGYSDLTFC